MSWGPSPHDMDLWGHLSKLSKGHFYVSTHQPLLSSFLPGVPEATHFQLWPSHILTLLWPVNAVVEGYLD
jgi:hypothetical protein